MRHKTHIRITRQMFPWIKPDIVQKVNHALDSPTRMQKGFSGFMGAPIEIPGLTMYPHRRYTHTMQEALMTGYLAGGIDGAYAAFGHIMGDIVRDQMVSRVGGEHSDILEAYYNYFQGKQARTRQNLRGQ